MSHPSGESNAYCFYELLVELAGDEAQVCVTYLSMQVLNITAIKMPWNTWRYLWLRCVLVYRTINMFCLSGIQEILMQNLDTEKACSSVLLPHRKQMVI